MVRLLPFILIAAPFLSAGEIHVSPGTPLTDAMEQARKAPKPVTLILGGGTYPITEAITLGPADSGTTWQAAPGAEPVISGGRRITGWKKLPDGLWQAEVPEVREGKWYFQQLWINGRRATRARTPNKGFLRMDDRASSVIFPSPAGTDAGKWEASLLYQSFTGSPETIAELAKASPADLRDLTIIIPHTWDVHHYHVREINTAANAVLMRGPGIRELLAHEPDGRFYAENYRAALDSPGEWFLGRDGVLLYQPLPGEDMAGAEVIAPVAGRLLTIDGGRDISFRGISFQHQQWTMGQDGFGDAQAAQSIGAAVEIDRSGGITFSQCEIARTGGYAIWFRSEASRCAITSSHLHDLGGGGVRIGPTSQRGGPRVTEFITVDDNIIQHGGRIFPDAIGVFIGHASDNTVIHNDIGDFYYSGISSGWHWGYGETRTHRNRFENNHIHHLGWGFTSDMGGFYNLGSSFGTVVRGNHIHHVGSYRYGGWGLYTDEGSSGIVMEDNLVHDTSESAFHQHYGFFNTVRNNILAFGGRAQVQRSRAEKHLSFVFENNILVWDPASAFLDGGKYNWEFPAKPDRGYPKSTTVFRNNLYWPLDGKMPDLIAGTWTWDSWRQEGRDAGSIVADPLFMSIPDRDFRLKPGSPAEKTGFRRWDLTLAGVRKDSPRGTEWRKLAAKAVFPNWQEDSKPWPSRDYGIALQTFEYSALGTIPMLGSTASSENKGDSVGVSAEAASPIPAAGAGPSRCSLKVKDAPGLSKSYNPLLSINPKWTGGTMNVAFDVMGRPGADWFVELRSAGGGEFGAGPYLACRKGVLTATTGAGIPLGELPPGSWARISITAAAGTGRWKVEVTSQDGARREHADLPCKTSWTQCHYLLWSALADTDTAFFIDNLHLSRTP